ncbi:hypothetical protein H4582DRAFT_2064852 [Lactarius indigo]|nr:hypothetical protein H4582DRAFT_2064852 [Lactarius indigo]
MADLTGMPGATGFVGSHVVDRTPRFGKRFTYVEYEGKFEIVEVEDIICCIHSDRGRCLSQLLEELSVDALFHVAAPQTPKTTVRSTVKVHNYARDASIKKIVAETLRTAWIAKAVSQDGGIITVPKVEKMF